MFFIVVGAGEIGYYLTELLLEEEHDIIVVDMDEEACKKISNELDIVAHHGDATDPKVLEKLGLREAEALVALTGSDETNMVVSLIAKELGAKSVAARLGKIEYDQTVLKKLGIDIVIHPEAAAAGYIAELITKPEVLDLAFISRGKAEIMEIEIKPNSKMVGKKISEIENPAGSAIIALVEEGRFVIPNLDYRIPAGAKVLILAKREVADKVRKILK